MLTKPSVLFLLRDSCSPHMSYATEGVEHTGAWPRKQQVSHHRLASMLSISQAAGPITSSSFRRVCSWCYLAARGSQAAA